MVVIKILGNKYEIPNNLSDIKLTRWLQYIRFIDLEMPEIMRSEEEIDLSDSNIKLVLFEFYCEELHFWTGCPVQDLRRFPMPEVYSIWAYLQHNLQPVEDLAFHKFECGGQMWHLPTRLMSDSTLEDYAEANNYEHELEKVMNREYESLFYIAAVICRKSKTEMYDDYQDAERIAFFKEHLTAYDANQIGFFLLRLSEKSLTGFQIYTTAQILTRLKQVSQT